MDFQLTSIMYDSRRRWPRKKGDPRPPTHSCIPGAKGTGFIGGSFHIPQGDAVIFMDAYIRALEAGDANGTKLNFTEHHAAVGPVVVDLDFKWRGSDASHARAATKEEVDAWALEYANHIAEVVDLPGGSTFRAVVMPRPGEPVMNKDNDLKHGLHLVFPDVVTTPEVQHVIREQALPGLSQLLEPLSQSNPVETVVDEAVIQSAGWLIYGSRKPDGVVYKAERIIMYQVVQRGEGEGGGFGVQIVATQEPPLATPGELVRLCSIRCHSQDACPGARSGFQPLVDRRNGGRDRDIREAFRRPVAVAARSDDTADQGEGDDNGGDVASDNAGGGTPTNDGRDAAVQQPDWVTDEVVQARELLPMLRKSRAEPRHEWIEVGMAVHSVSPQLFAEWDEWSKSCNAKYEAAACATQWESFGRNVPACRLTLGSLHHWAKEDSAAAYEVWSAARAKPISGFAFRADPEVVEPSVNSEDPKVKRLLQLAKDTSVMSDFALAEAALDIIPTRFKYSGAKAASKGPWFKFDPAGHRWQGQSGDHGLMNALSVVVVPALQEAKRQVGRVLGTDDNGVEIINPTWSFFNTAELRLARRTGKEAVHREMRDLVVDEKFEEKLDSCYPHLIGFNNGVYDLLTGSFRPGRPEDHISMSTGVPFVPYNPDTLEARWLHNDFLAKVLTDPKVRAYVLQHLASALDGQVRPQLWVVWTGTGANGKSKVLCLLDLALGDYFTTFEPSAFTKHHEEDEKPSPILMDARNRRIAVMTEPDANAKVKSGKMKKWTGGDLMRARNLYRADPVKFRFMPTLVMACNDVPHTDNNDGGVERRMRLVEFGSKFVDNPAGRAGHFKCDPDLDAKLKDVAPTFAAYLVHLYNKYKRDGYALPTPACVAERTRRHQVQGDPAAGFVECALRRVDRVSDTDAECAWISREGLWTLWQDWWACQGAVKRNPLGLKEETLDKLAAKMGVAMERRNGKDGYAGWEPLPITIG
jgi:P4 family phage/plasmid primase-like protien